MVCNILIDRSLPRWSLYLRCTRVHSRRRAPLQPAGCAASTDLPGNASGRWRFRPADNIQLKSSFPKVNLVWIRPLSEWSRPSKYTDSRTPRPLAPKRACINVQFENQKQTFFDQIAKFKGRWRSLLDRNVQRFRGGLVFKAHRLCVSLNSRLESNKEE